MSAPTLYVDPQLADPRAARGLRLRLKPAHQSCGSVHGTWWPRSTQLFIELRTLLAALYQRLGRIDRVIYDENGWAPASLRMEFQGPQCHPGRLQRPVDQHSLGDRRARQAGSAGGSALHRPRPGARVRDESSQPGRCFDRRRTAGDRRAGG